MNPREIVKGLTQTNAKERSKFYRDVLHVWEEQLASGIEWADVMSSSEIKKVISNLKNDLGSKNKEEMFEAVGVSVLLFSNQSFVSHLNISNQKSIFEILMRNLRTNIIETRITNRVLQCLSKSKFTKDVYANNHKENLEVLLGLLQSANVPSSFIAEVLQVIFLLYSAGPITSEELHNSWFPSLFSHMCHTDSEVRKAAVPVARKIGEALNTMPDDGLRKNVLKAFLSDANKFTKDMLQHMDKNQFDIPRVLRTIIILLGKELYTHKIAVNALLNVMEKAFKHPRLEVRVEAYLSWHTLIDNFALTDQAISNVKAIQMFMLPFKIQRVKSVEISRTKLLTWWHFICVLSKKNCLIPNFELVVVPFLSFCFERGLIPDGSSGVMNSRNLMMSGALASPNNTCSSLHHTCAEMLAQLLSHNDVILRWSFVKECIGEHVLSSTLLLRHNLLIMKCFLQAIRTLDFSDGHQKVLGIFLSTTLVRNVKTAYLENYKRQEAVAMMREFFNMLEEFQKYSREEVSMSSFLFEFYNILTTGREALPDIILNSNTLHIGLSRASVGVNSIMCGTISNYLISQLCFPGLINHAVENERFFTVWETVLEKSQPATGKLQFFEATIKEMEASAVPALSPNHPDVLRLLWSSVVNETVEHIKQINSIVDDGDDGDSKWGCIYSLLYFPITHASVAFSCANITIYKEIMKPWKRLWQEFIHFTQLTPTVEPNTDVEQVASTMMSLCQKDVTDEAVEVSAPMYYLIVEVLAQITKTFVYADLGKDPAEMPLSPVKPKRKQHPLHNLGTCVDLTLLVLKRVSVMVTRLRHHMAEKLCLVSNNMMRGILKAPGKYLQPFVSCMVKILCEFIRINPAALFDHTVEESVADMLTCFRRLVQIYIARAASKDNLQDGMVVLEPLFSTSYESSSDRIKMEVYKLLPLCIESITDVGSELPASLLTARKKWQSLYVADTADSTEGFTEARPSRSRKKATNHQKEPRASSSSKISVRKSTTKSSLTEKTNLAEKNKDGDGDAFKPDQAKLYPRKTQRKGRSASLLSPNATAAAASLPKENSSQSAIGKNKDLQDSGAVGRNKKGTKSQKYGKKKNSPTELLEKERKYNDDEDELSLKQAAGSSIEPVVSSSGLVPNILENNDADNDSPPFSSLRKKGTIENSKGYSSSDIQKVCTTKNLDLSSVPMNVESETLATIPPTKGKSRDRDGKGDSKVMAKKDTRTDAKISEEESDHDLPDISFSDNVDQMLNENGSQDEIESMSSSAVEKAPPSSNTSLDERPVQPDHDRLVRETLPVEPSIKRRRSKEKHVSPSVKCQDEKPVSNYDRVVREILQVEPSMKRRRSHSKEKHVSPSVISKVDIDSNDDILSSLKAKTSLSRSSSYSSEKGSPEKTRAKEKLLYSSEKWSPDKTWAKEKSPSKSRSVEPAASGTLDKKRKRKLFEGPGRSEDSSKKKVKTDTISLDHSYSNSLNDSTNEVIEISDDEEDSIEVSEEHLAGTTRQSVTSKYYRNASDCKIKATNSSKVPVTENTSQGGSSDGYLTAEGEELPPCESNKVNESLTEENEKSRGQETNSQCTGSEFEGGRKEVALQQTNTVEPGKTGKDSHISSNETLPTEETEQITEPTQYTDKRLMQKTNKRGAKTKTTSRRNSCPVDDSAQRGRNKMTSVFSPKQTRSGRRIVAPNKDMPVPITPPKPPRKRLLQKDPSEADKTNSQDIDMELDDLTNKVSNLDDKSSSVDADDKAEEAVEEVLAAESSMEQAHQNSWENIEESISENEFCFDSPVTGKLPAGEKVKRSKARDSDTCTLPGTKRGVSQPHAPESKRQKSTVDSVQKSSSGTITLSSEDSVKVVEVRCVENPENDSLNMKIENLKSALNEKQNSHVSDGARSSCDKEANSSESNHSTSKESMAEMDKEQTHQEVIEEKGGGRGAGTDQSGDSSVQQRASSESTPMECGQTLVEEVMYPIISSSRGTIVASDSTNDLETPCDKDTDTRPIFSNSDEDLGELPKANSDNSGDGKAVEEEEGTLGDDKAMEEEGTSGDGKAMEEEKGTLGDVTESTGESKKGHVEEEEGEEDMTMSKDKEALQGDDNVLTKMITGKHPMLSGDDYDSLEETRRDHLSSVDGNSDGDGEVMIQEDNEAKKEEEKNKDEVEDQKDKEKEKDYYQQRMEGEVGEEEKMKAVSVMDKETACQELEQPEEQREPSDPEKGASHEIKSSTVTELEQKATLHSDIISLSSVEDRDVPREHSELEEMDAISSGSQHHAKDILDQDMEMEIEVANVGEAISTEHSVEQNTSCEPQDNDNKEEMEEREPDNAPAAACNGEQGGITLLSKTLEGNREVEEELTLDGKWDKSSDSPGRKAQIDDTFSDSNHFQAEKVERSANSISSNNVAVFSPVEKTVTDQSSLKMTSQSMEEVAKVEISSCDKETVFSSNKNAQTIDTSPLNTDSGPTECSEVVSVGKVTDTDKYKPDAAEAPATEIVSKVMADSRSSCSSTSSNSSSGDEALEEPVGGSSKQQEDDLSPEKTSRSRLKLTVSTPERMKKSGGMRHAGSRAALLLACAKKNIKNRNGAEASLPSGVLAESVRYRPLGSSPTRKSHSRSSPSHSPDTRRRSHNHNDNLGALTWVRHSPSPGASPTASILKRTLHTDANDGDTPSPPPSKQKLVSFADPPVSREVRITPFPEEMEIPPYMEAKRSPPKADKSMKAQKRLDMARAAASPRIGSSEEDKANMSLETPFFPSLVSCQNSVEDVAKHLTAPDLVERLIRALERQDVYTVGQLCKLNEQVITNLPVMHPKTTNTRRVLREYEKTLPEDERVPQAGSPVMQQSASPQVFKKMDPDKENHQPNQQDRVSNGLVEAAAETEAVSVAEGVAEVGVRESSGRGSYSHSDNLQEIMEMEDIMPLDSAADETLSIFEKSMRQTVNEGRLAFKEMVLNDLLLYMPIPTVAKAINACLLARMGNLPSTAAVVSPAIAPATTTTNATPAAAATTSTANTKSTDFVP